MAVGQSNGIHGVRFHAAGIRGHGLSRVLLAEALGYLKAHGLQHAGLEVKAENRTALGVYTGLGYEVNGETDVYEVELVG
ncbi:MAG: GNAT family N-acetyltransferase [Chloroflexota bacterium]